jgi:hypothetical protein
MDNFIGSDRCPNLGYLSIAMAMFDQYEHQIGAFQWLEYQISPELLSKLLNPFPTAVSIAEAACIFDGTEPQILACESIESDVKSIVMVEFWDRFMYTIIDRNTLVLGK